jgi:hypothetical protein
MFNYANKVAYRRFPHIGFSAYSAEESKVSAKAIL